MGSLGWVVLLHAGPYARGKKKTGSHFKAVKMRVGIFSSLCHFPSRPKFTFCLSLFVFFSLKLGLFFYSPAFSNEKLGNSRKVILPPPPCFKEILYIYNFRYRELKLSFGLKPNVFPKIQYFCDFLGKWDMGPFSFINQHAFLNACLFTRVSGPKGGGEERKITMKCFPCSGQRGQTSNFSWKEEDKFF